MRILVTGAAGFIGAELSIQLLAAGHSVVGIDNLNNYYDVSLKRDRLKRVKSTEHADNFQFEVLEEKAQPPCTRVVEYGKDDDLKLPHELNDLPHSSLILTPGAWLQHVKAGLQPCCAQLNESLLAT